MAEIEAALLQIPQIAQAVVDSHEPEAGIVELVAYYTTRKHSPELKALDIAKILRAELPEYMVPVYFEKLPIIPMTAANKVDRTNLPLPKHRISSGRSKVYHPPRNGAEKRLEKELKSTLKLPRISRKDHFFDDLGAHSLLMAKFCSAVRGNGE